MKYSLKLLLFLLTFLKERSVINLLNPKSGRNCHLENITVTDLSIFNTPMPQIEGSLLIRVLLYLYIRLLGQNSLKNAGTLLLQVACQLGGWRVDAGYLKIRTISAQMSLNWVLG